jgi:transposase
MNLVGKKNYQITREDLIKEIKRFKKPQHLTAHTRKAKLSRQPKSFVSFTKFVSTKAFRSTFLALQVCAKRYLPF